MNTEKSFEDWVTARDGLEDHELCPCDNHPAERCVTCRGACCCHFIDEAIQAQVALTESIVNEIVLEERPSEAVIVYDPTLEDE